MWPRPRAHTSLAPEQQAVSAAAEGPACAPSSQSWEGARQADGPGAGAAVVAAALGEKSEEPGPAAFLPSERGSLLDVLTLSTKWSQSRHERRGGVLLSQNSPQEVLWGWRGPSSRSSHPKARGLEAGGGRRFPFPSRETEAPRGQGCARGHTPGSGVSPPKPNRLGRGCPGASAEPAEGGRAFSWGLQSCIHFLGPLCPHFRCAPQYGPPGRGKWEDPDCCQAAGCTPSPRVV